jgi:hypothetical protein
MEAVIEEDALTELRSSIHNDGTWYDYALILSGFLEDIGVALERTQDLRSQMDSLGNKRSNKARELREKILRIQANDFVLRARRNPHWAYECIKNWIVLRQAEADAKKRSGNTVRGYIRPIRKLCDLNDVPLTSSQWAKIYSKFGKAPRTGKDKPYTVEQIKKIIAFPDRRIKPSVLIMTSSGCRVGAFEFLNLGDIRPIYQNEDGNFDESGTLAEPLDSSRKLVACRIVIYRDEPEEYLPFITPECTRAIEEYANYRRQAGEKINVESPVLRDLFVPDKGARGEPHLPIRLAMSSVKNLILDAIVGQQLRPAKLPEGKRRWDFQMNHGLRKYFETTCDDHDVNLIHTEKLMGWGGGKLGLRIHYNRSEWRTLLLSYLKVVPHLTITDEERYRVERDNIAERVGDQKAKEFESEILSLRAKLEDMSKQQLSQQKQRAEKTAKLEDRLKVVEEMLGKFVRVNIAMDGQMKILYSDDAEEEVQAIAKEMTASGLKVTLGPIED